MGINQIPAAAGGVSVRRQDFTTSGSWTAPTGVTVAKVLLVGGGGGGSTYPNTTTYAGTLVAQGGGGGGQVIEKYISVNPGTSYTITIGSGGSSGTDNSNDLTLGPGNVGGDSSFGSLLTARGGGGGGNQNQIVYARYSLGGYGGSTSAAAGAGASGGGGGAGLPYEAVFGNMATYNNQMRSLYRAHGKDAIHPTNGGSWTGSTSLGLNDQVNSFGSLIYQANNYSTMPSYEWFGGALGGYFTTWSGLTGTNNVRFGRRSGGDGGQTGLGFGGGGGGSIAGGATLSFAGTTLTNNGTNHNFAAGKGFDGGGNGAYTNNSGSGGTAATAGTANSGGGGGAGVFNAYGTQTFSGQPGGSGYCVVEWIA